MHERTVMGGYTTKAVRPLVKSSNLQNVFVKIAKYFVDLAYICCQHSKLYYSIYINIQICWYCTDTFVNIYVIANSFTQYFPNKYLYKFIDHKFPGNSWINLSSQLSPKYGDMKNIGNIIFFFFSGLHVYGKRRSV